MKKLLVLLLACLMWTSAFAETTAPEPLELMPYLGNITWKELRPLIPETFISGNRVKSGMMMYLGDSLDSGLNDQYAHSDAEVSFGWEHETVFYVSISKTGYSLSGVSVGDNVADVDARCLADGWTKMDVPPDMLDGSYEKTVDDVRYTLGYIIEYGTECVNFVSIQAAKISE